MPLPPTPLQKSPLIPSLMTMQSMESALSTTHSLQCHRGQHCQSHHQQRHWQRCHFLQRDRRRFCDASNATTGVDSNNEETSNAAINMAALSPTAESSTNTLVDNTATAARNDNDNIIAAVVQVASQMVSILCTIIRWKIILNLNYFIFNKYSHTNVIISSPCMTLMLVSS